MIGKRGERRSGISVLPARHDDDDDDDLNPSRRKKTEFRYVKPRIKIGLCYILLVWRKLINTSNDKQKNIYCQNLAVNLKQK